MVVKILHDGSDKKAGNMMSALRKVIGSAAAKVVMIKVFAFTSGFWSLGALLLNCLVLFEHC